MPQLAMALLKFFAQSPDRVNMDYIFKDEVTQAAPDRENILARLSDAWAWLESHGLVGVDPHNMTSTWQRLTSAGIDFASDEHALTKLWAGERLSGKFDPVLASALTNFHFGDYQTACFAAMKEVEVAVRAAAGLSNSVVGVHVMRQALKPQDGPLTDTTAEGGEQVAIMELFSGAIGAFKNPNSHRSVDYDDAVEAAEIIQLADLLLRIVRRAAARTT
ncbi:TIGR02391 family protein [Mycolicibacterium sp. CR10]|uniref:TIGR02391 family protein n=1 Tax=Mycolicibacterium sp. CR10 TaxID=2562314 RepID=UPI001F0FA01F|nr:TIGR02391 family protein [Mycolicibacterium sp. CR10]